MNTLVREFATKRCCRLQYCTEFLIKLQSQLRIHYPPIGGFVRKHKIPSAHEHNNVSIFIGVHIFFIWISVYMCKKLSLCLPSLSLSPLSLSLWLCLWLCLCLSGSVSQSLALSLSLSLWLCLCLSVSGSVSVSQSLAMALPLSLPISPNLSFAPYISSYL
jgi:hypothetical protein